MPHKLEVGKKLKPNPPHEGVFPAIIGVSLDIYAYFSKVTDEEIMAWRKGPLEYGLFINYSIPVFVCNIKGFGNFDLPINFLLESDQVRQTFLMSEPEANAITLVLAGFPIPIIKVIRLIGIDPIVMQDIKGACLGQIAKYSSAIEVTLAINLLTEFYTTDQLYALGKMRPLTPLSP